MTEPNAHTLTLKFHRFLSQDEWQKVAKAVELFVPFVQEMEANAVLEPAEERARVRPDVAALEAKMNAARGHGSIEDKVKDCEARVIALQAEVAKLIKERGDWLLSDDYR